MNKKILIIIPLIIILGISIPIMTMFQTMDVPVVETEIETKVEFQTTNLFDLGMDIQDEIVYVNNILDPIEKLDCYAIAWYHDEEEGQAIVYSKAFEEIKSNVPESLNAFKFMENQLVKKYLEINCLHLNYASEIPEDYTITIGMLPNLACTNYHSEKWCEEAFARTFDVIEEQ